MIMGTKKSTDYLVSSIDDSIKTLKSNSLNKSDFELVKTNTNNTDTSDKFVKVLDSKTNLKEKDSSTVEDTKVKDSSGKDKSKIDELNDKLKELEEDSKSDPKDKVNESLEELLNLLKGLGFKEDDLKTDGKINLDILKSILNDGKSSNNNMNSIMQKIMELLKEGSVKDKLNTSSLKLMNNILSNLNDKLGNDNLEAKKGIKNLMSEIANVLNDKQNQSSNKVLTLEDMLNKNYSQSNSDSSTQDESNSAAMSRDNKDTSKEDKFLKSLLDDKKDDASNKINLFASRTAAIQNQGGTATVRGLTINKATFTNDLIKDVKFMNTNSLKELTVKINPGNLGEITIKLVEEDGLMKANLKANSKETTALLSQNLADIKKQLSEQNIKVSDVNIELYQDDTTFFKDQGFQGQLAGEQNRQNNNSQSNTSKSTQGIVTEDLDENLAEENNNVNFFA